MVCCTELCADNALVSLPSADMDVGVAVPEANEVAMAAKVRIAIVCLSLWSAVLSDCCCDDAELPEAMFNPTSFQASCMTAVELRMSFLSLWTCGVLYPSPWSLSVNDLLDDDVIC